VSRGDKLAEIETDKAAIGYEADVDRTLKVLARASDTVPVGTTIAVIDEAGAAAEQAQGGQRPTEYPESAVASSELPGSPLATTSSRHLLRPGIWPVSCGSSWRR
jgi:pyruvate/2-oxoglutarate dehydrogenase complex dihydrolipoamide acyltransferase (E2) component